MRTDPPAKRWMKVSRSPITIAQPSICSSHSCFFRSICLSITLSLSLQFRSPHPCSREINPRSPTSVEREQSLSLANCGSSCRVDSGGRPARRTLPHHSPTGHWAPQPQLPLNNSTVCLSQVAAASAVLSAMPRGLQGNVCQHAVSHKISL